MVDNVEIVMAKNVDDPRDFKNEKPLGIQEHIDGLHEVIEISNMGDYIIGGNDLGFASSNLLHGCPTKVLVERWDASCVC